jgi:SAM-dependent methyltransferase
MAITQNIMREIQRVLKPDGIFAMIANSIDDPEYGTGTKLEEDVFELSSGDIKRFFSEDSLRNFVQEYFEIVLLDNHGTTHKDIEKGVSNLIRFVGRRH